MMRLTRTRMKFLRFIEADADASGSAQEDANAETADDSTDWEAKYREAVSHSRTWEKRAKENSAAAAELEKLKAEKLTETERATARAEKAEKELAALKHGTEVTNWKVAAAKETGVPVDLLRGDTEEDINAHANALKSFLETASKPKAANVSNPTGTPKSAGYDPNRQLLKQLFGSN